MKILVCDDHALFREGLGFVLGELDAAPTVLEAGDAQAALALVGENPDLDLVLLDLGLPGRPGLSVLTELRERFPEVPVAILSASEGAAVVRQALAAGACGFVPKSSSGPVLRSALELIFAGGIYVPAAVLENETRTHPPPATQGHGGAQSPAKRVRGLTARQNEVLPLLARGLTNREIADVLAISEGTVKFHVASILERLDVSNRTEVAFLLPSPPEDGS